MFYMIKNSFSKNINKTEKSMGFICLSKKEALLFPKLKRKIIVISSLLPKQKIICTFDPNYNRIYGLKKLFQNSKMESIFITKKTQKEYIINQNGITLT